MNSLNNTVAIKAVCIFGILAWLALLYFKGIETPLTFEALKEIPASAGYVGLFAVLFSKYIWKIRWLQGWMVLVPNLNGTWEGELASNWKDPQTGNQQSPIKVFLIIRQTLFNTSCVLLTKESKSWSRAVTIQNAPDGTLKILEFTYSNFPRPSVHHRSNAHDGACSLEIINGRGKKLVGKYWTERGTNGELTLTFRSRKHRESFDM